MVPGEEGERKKRRGRLEEERAANRREHLGDVKMCAQRGGRRGGGGGRGEGQLGRREMQLGEEEKGRDEEERKEKKRQTNFLN